MRQFLGALLCYIINPSEIGEEIYLKTLVENYEKYNKVYNVYNILTIMEEKIDYFNRHYMDYDKWYDLHLKEYNDQINFIRSVIPEGNGIEIGVGTGRFAYALNIKYGIDISESMVSLAKMRGINALVASAYSIPYPDKYFDFSLNMVTICFLDFPEKAIMEAKEYQKIALQ